MPAAPGATLLALRPSLLANMKCEEYLPQQALSPLGATSAEKPKLLSPKVKMQMTAVKRADGSWHASLFFRLT